MNRLKIIQIGGLSAMAGGLLGFAGFLPVEAFWTWWLFLLLFSWLGGLVGLTALNRVSWLGRGGLGMAILSILALGSVFTIGPPSNWNFAILPLGFLLGMGVYGLDAIRLRPLPRGNEIPLLIVFTFALQLAVERGTIDGIWRVRIEPFLLPVVGIFWVLLGISMIQIRAQRWWASWSFQAAATLVMVSLGAGLAFAQYRSEACTTIDPRVKPTSEGDPRLVIVDTDMAHEDMMATTFLLQYPGLQVKAITVAGTGEAHCDAGVQHALGLGTLSGNPEIPVACGPEKPLIGDRAFPSPWRQGADDLYGLSLPANPSPPSPLLAPELIATTVKNAPRKVTIIALGPLTNLGEALKNHPEIVPNLEEIYVMGGAIELGGNVGLSGVGIDNPFAEWNIYIDPRAANLVFSSGVPVTLVPLNATRYAPVTTRFLRCAQDHRTTAEAGFVYDMLVANYDFIQTGGFQFWDSLTAAIATDESLATFETLNLMVLEEDPGAGYTMISSEGSPVRVAKAADGVRFESLFLNTLNEFHP
jgi:pyrimidine-specific ribonucleoside hydrolase